MYHPGQPGPLQGPPRGPGGGPPPSGEGGGGGPPTRGPPPPSLPSRQIQSVKSHDSDRHFSHVRGPPPPPQERNNGTQLSPAVTTSKSFEQPSLSGMVKVGGPAATAATGPPRLFQQANNSTPKKPPAGPRGAAASETATAAFSTPVRTATPSANTNTAASSVPRSGLLSRPTTTLLRPPRSLPRPAIGSNNSSRNNSPVPTRHKFRLPPGAASKAATAGGGDGSTTAAATTATVKNNTLNMTTTRTPHSSPVATPQQPDAVVVTVSAVNTPMIALPVVPATTAATTTADVVLETTATAPEELDDTAVAATSIDTDLLPDWEQVTDPGTGRDYYYNACTGETCWELPVVATVVAVSNPEPASTVVVVETAPRHGKAAVPSPEQAVVSHEPVETAVFDTVVTDTTNTNTATHDSAALPPGWVEHADPQSGGVYYFCATNGTTQWERPMRDVVDSAVDEVQVEEYVPVEEPFVPTNVDTEVVGQEPIVGWEEEPSAPVEENPMGLVAAAEFVAEQNIVAPTVAGEVSPTLASLPSGWEEVVDPNSGNLYYYHAELGVTSWDFPDQSDGTPQATDEPSSASPTSGLEMEAENQVGTETGESTPLESTGTAVDQEDSSREAVGTIVDELVFLTVQQSQSEESAVVSSDEVVYESASGQEGGDADADVAAQPDVGNAIMEPTLPQVWETHIDEASGRTYYCNLTDGTTSWEIPVAIAAAAAAAAGVPTSEEAEGTVPFDNAIDVDGELNTANSDSGSESESESESDDSRTEDDSDVLDEDEDDEPLVEEVETTEQALPDGWEVAFDEASDRTYYYNTADGASLWERPVALDSTPEVELENDEAPEEAQAVDPSIVEPDTTAPDSAVDAYQAPAEDNAEVVGGAEEPVAAEADTELQQHALPDGWEEVFDEASDRTYYCNAADGTTVWERPRIDSVLSETGMDGTPAPEEVHEQAHLSELPPEDTGASAVVDAYSQQLEEEDAVDTHAPPGTNPEEDVEEEDVQRHTVPTGPPLLSVGNLLQGWEELIDEASGNPYYVCEANGVSSWDRPVQALETTEEEAASSLTEGVAFVDECEQEDESGHPTLDAGATDRSEDPSTVELAESGQEDDSRPEETTKGLATTLADGWEELIDPDSGRPYYSREADGLTIWERPTYQQDERIHDENVVVPDTEESLDTTTPPLSVQHFADTDPSEESERVDDATVATSAPKGDELRAGWVEVADQNSGKPYYFNELENATSWERPMDETDMAAGQDIATDVDIATEEVSGVDETASDPAMESVDAVEPEMETNGERCVDTGQPETPAPMVKNEGLPAGWTKRLEEASGRIYYHNAIDGITVWERPLGVAEESETVPGPPTEADLPAGWAQLVDKTSGGTCYCHAESDERTWTRPALLNGTDHETAAVAPTSDATRNGNSRGAIASFGFGGQLSVCRPSGGASTQVTVHRAFDLAPSDVLVGVESTKRAAGIVGPLNAAADESVAAYIEEMATGNPNDLLWNLILIASKSQGLLNSDEGINRTDSPETAIVQLLLRDGDLSQPNVNGASANSTYAPQQSERSGASSESSLTSVHGMVVRGQREGAVDEAIANGEFAMALLVAAMCSPEKYELAAKQYAEKVLMPGSPMYTATMMYIDPTELHYPGSWGGDSDELRRTWRIHLAAIISNRVRGWNRVVLSLGDHLRELGETHAAHFCYIYCGLPLQSCVRPDSRLTLLGYCLAPEDVALTTSGSIEAFTYTEAYEWTKRRGNPNAAIPIFQGFKLSYAMRLADLGYTEEPQRYLTSILDCMGVRLEDLDVPEDPPPLNVSIIRADRSGLLAALALFERRLVSRDFGEGFDATKEAARELDLQVPVSDETDADLSFRTAHTNIHDMTHLPEPPIKDAEQRKSVSKQSKKDVPKRSMPRKNKSSNNNALPREERPEFAHDEAHERPAQDNPIFMAVQPPAMLQPPMASNPQPANPAPQQPPAATNPSTPTKQATAPLFMQAPPMLASTPTKPPPQAASPPSTKEPPRQPAVASTPDQHQGNAKKKQVAPMSAPAAIPSSTQKRGSLFPNLGFTDKVRKFMNPNATTAHPGEEMKAYYDNDLKVWVFPGEDPVELAKPIGAPPTVASPMAATPSPQTAPAAAANDPLAAMMAPPQRAPQRPAMTTPNRLMGPPGGMPTPMAGAPPQFAVFKPAPAAKKEEKSEEEE